MGLFRFLRHLVGSRQEAMPRGAAARTDAAAAAGRDAAPGSKSALSRGRMRQTDQIKGPNSPLPNKPGVYRFVSKTTREVEYVGQTNDLRKRQQQHARAGKLDTEKQHVQWAVAKETATKDDLCQTEVHHIARHHPSGNKTKGANGRR